MSFEEAVLKFREVLKARERVAPTEVNAYQRILVIKLIQHARAQVPFYRDRLEPISASGEEFLEYWSKVPLLSRADIQRSKEKLHARTIPPYFGTVQAGSTSGSSGRPLRYRSEELHEVASAAQTDRMFGWWRLDGKKALATFMSTYDESARAGDKKRYGWRFGFPGGVRYIFELMVDIDKQIDWLKSVRPNYLFARGGAHISELALQAEKRGERLRFECILSTGSSVSPEARRMARRVFKAAVADLYGATETGLIACQCPDCGLYHVCDETILVELLRDDGSPCKEGESGRVILTPLYGYAMPFIRYEIGDYATRGPEQATCGRGLSSLSSIVGRYRNVFILKDGRVIHPYANASQIGEHLSYRQIQIVQTDYDRIEIRYVQDDASRTPNTAEIEKLMQRLVPGVSVTLVPLERFEPNPTGKFEETVSLVPRGGQIAY